MTTVRRLTGLGLTFVTLASYAPLLSGPTTCVDYRDDLAVALLVTLVSAFVGFMLATAPVTR